MQTIRQSSPRYIPEIIFSNLMGNLNKENSLQAIKNISRESYDYAMQSYFKKTPITMKIFYITQQLYRTGPLYPEQCMVTQ